MAVQTDAQLKTAAGIIKNETTPLANTANRIGTFLENVVDSKPEYRTGATFVPATGLQLDRGLTIYNQYTQSGALNLIIASGNVEGGKAKLIIETDGSAITVAGATQHPKSDDFDLIIGNLNLVEFEQIAGTIYYNITNLS